MIPQNVRITYWCDTASGDTYPVWIVDIADDAGCETLSTHPTESEARCEAKRQAARRGLPCIYVDKHGVEAHA